MQVFLLDKHPGIAAISLLEASPQAATTTIREGQQLLSVSAAAYAMPPLFKLDGTHYSSRNHVNHPWAKWLREDYRNWHYLFHVVLVLVWKKHGKDSKQLRRLEEYQNEHTSLHLPWIDPPDEVPFLPHKDLANDERLRGLASFEAHRAYVNVKYNKENSK